jgi:hypothetical protein
MHIATPRVRIRQDPSSIGTTGVVVIIVTLEAEITMPVSAIVLPFVIEYSMLSISA